MHEGNEWSQCCKSLLSLRHTKMFRIIARIYPIVVAIELTIAGYFLVVAYHYSKYLEQCIFESLMRR